MPRFFPGYAFLTAWGIVSKAIALVKRQAVKLHPATSETIPKSLL
jgi:hypothetical protein